MIATILMIIIMIDVEVEREWPFVPSKYIRD